MVAKSWMNIGGVKEIGAANIDWYAGLRGVWFPSEYGKQNRAGVPLKSY